MMPMIKQLNIEYFYTRPTIPVIEHVRSANVFMRTIAGIVAVTFIMLILAPTAAAAHKEYDQWQQTKALAGSDVMRKNSLN